MVIKNFKQFLLEDFANIHPKNKWEDIADEKNEYAKILMDLINNAYNNNGGNIQGDIIKDPTVTYWKAIDVDSDPDCDAVIYGKTTKFGAKITGIGQDGGKLAKTSVIHKLTNELRTDGFYTEISENLVKFMNNIPYINNKEEVEKILQKKIDWVGTIDDYPNISGWYYRNIDGHKKLKLLVGHPKGISKKDISI